MATRDQSTSRATSAAVGPGVAFHAALGGEPRSPRSSVVTPATPREAMGQMQADIVRKDLRDAWEAIRNHLAGEKALDAAEAAGAAVPRAAGPLGLSALLHELIRTHLKNEDLRAQNIVASHDLMPNVHSPYDDDPQTAGSGNWVTAPDGRLRYVRPGYMADE